MTRNPHTQTVQKRVQLQFMVSGVALALVWLLLRGGQALAEPAAPGATPPTGFTDALVVGVSAPTALAFTPDGRLLVTSQPGQVRVVLSGVVTQALDLSANNKICSDFERGLLGVAVDPNFTTNQYVYLYYTFNKFNAPNAGACDHNSGTAPVNRVSRFVLQSSNTLTAETVLLDNIPSPNGNHNAGDLHFGADGLLYVSAGEGGSTPEAAQQLNVLGGKVLRIQIDGTAPLSNPYASEPTSRRCGDPAGVPGGSGKCKETFAHGLRNPFRFAFVPGSNQFYINDVGQNAWEEIDIGQAGVNYGWPCREGKHGNQGSGICNPQPVSVDPIYEYNHSTGCYVITGGAFVPAGLWPAPYDAQYLFGDYGCGMIMMLSQSSGVYVTSTFATNAGGDSITAMTFGPYSNTQALYYISYASGGQVRRIWYNNSTNQPPLAVISATPTYGYTPLVVSFDGSGSFDPDSNLITYTWSFGDGVILSDVVSSTLTHTYNITGVYTASLTVRDALSTSSPARIRIDVGNTPPTPTISAPLTNTLFRVGQIVTLTGSATDSEDGALPAAALSWRVILHHVDQTNPGNAHTHPYYGPTAGNNITFTTPAPEDLGATAFSYLEIQLTATDNGGLWQTITQTLQPRRVNVTFVTQPASFTLSINNTTITATRVISSWDGYSLNIAAPVLQSNSSNQWWKFSAWSDAGAISHTVTTLSAP